MRRVSLGLVGGLLGSGLGGRLNRSFSGGGLLDRSLGSGGDLGGGLSFLDDSLLRAYRLGDKLDDGGAIRYATVGDNDISTLLRTCTQRKRGLPA